MGHHQQWISGERNPEYFGIDPDASDGLTDVMLRRPAIVAYTAGHTHRHRVRLVGRRLPSIEVGCVKDFPGTWAEYRVYDGGILQVVHRVSSPEALAWSEECRVLYSRLRRRLRQRTRWARSMTAASPSRSAERSPTADRRTDAGTVGRMSEFDAAAAAVQAALDAGARYADARVMHRRYEAMAARNGEVEELTQDEDAGDRGAGPRRLGMGLLRPARPVRRSGAASRRPGRRVAAASARVARQRRSAVDPGRAGDGLVGQRVRRRPARRRAGREGRPAGAGDGDDARARRRHRRGPVPDLGHGEVARVERWSSHRPAHPRVRRRDHGDRHRRRRDAAPVVPRRPRAVRHAGLGARPTRSTSRPTPPGSARSARRCCRRRRARRRDDADPRRRADGAADPRVGRPCHRARPDPRLGGGVRRDLVARPGPARRRCSTARS